jgi:hypothetical protein
MRRRSESCASDLKLDRWLAGELTPDAQQELVAHVNACESCRERHAALTESRQSFARQAPPLEALAHPQPSLSKREPRQKGSPGPVISSHRALANRPAQRVRSRWLAGASALAAAAALALGIGKPWSTSIPSGADTTGSGTRTKGGLGSLGWVVRRGEHVFAGRPEQTLRAGDAVRFSVSTREPVYVAILGLDPKGHLSVYHSDGEQLSKVEAGRDQLLPAAVELDATPGAEQFYGVFCPSAVALSPVKDAILRSPDAPALPLGCSSERWTLNKESP